MVPLQLLERIVGLGTWAMLFARAALAFAVLSLVYTLLVVRPLKLMFPGKALDITVCHDDTTIIAPTFLHPAHTPPQPLALFAP